MTSGEIGAAGLDVTYPEPLPVGHPLLALDNCLVLPHIAWAAWPVKQHVAKVTVDTILAGLKGQPLPHPLS